MITSSLRRRKGQNHRRSRRNRASGARSLICNDPSEDRLDRGEAWIFRLAHDGEQLKPELVVGASST